MSKIEHPDTGLDFFHGPISGLLIEAIAILLGAAIWVTCWAGLPS